MVELKRGIGIAFSLGYWGTRDYLRSCGGVALDRFMVNTIKDAMILDICPFSVPPLTEHWIRTVC